MLFRVEDKNWKVIGTYANLRDAKTEAVNRCLEILNRWMDLKFKTGENQFTELRTETYGCNDYNEAKERVVFSAILESNKWDDETEMVEEAVFNVIVEG